MSDNPTYSNTTHSSERLAEEELQRRVTELLAKHRRVRLAEYAAADLITELCERGALKILQRTAYLPGIVQERYRHAVPEGTEQYARGNPALQRTMADAIHAFTRDLLNERVLEVSHGPAIENGYKDAPPTDTVVSVSLLVPNPAYREEPDDYDPEGGDQDDT